MNVNIENFDKINIDNNTLQKLLFIYNALNDGWNIKKCEEKYIFTKCHNNKEIYFSESYLEEFVKNNSNFSNFK